MTSTSGVVAIQKKTRAAATAAAAASEHFATLQPAQKTKFKVQTQRKNHTPIHDNTQLLPHLIRKLHHHPTEIREIMPGQPDLATQVEEGNRGLKTLNPKPLLLGFRV